MKSMTIKEITDACAGSFIGEPQLYDTLVEGIRIDSRQVKSGELFVAVKGENNDGHDYIDSAFENGAVCAVSEKPLSGRPHILVKSTFAALKDIAEYYRSLFDIKVIGITGSVGKTTAKEMIASVLSQKYSVLKTEGNFNNEFGLPQTIFNIEEEHEIAVIEMGMSEAGEISRLSKIARPDAAVIINIGESHIGNLGSRGNIFKAKCEMFEYMDKDAPAFLNGDDDMLSAVKGENVIFFGRNGRNDVALKRITSSDMAGTRILADYFGLELELFIPNPGEYLIYPALAAAAVGMKFGLNAAEIAKGIEEYIPVSQRMDITDTGRLTIIDDVYNASRQSILAGAQTLKFAKSRSVAIVGDVLELGEYAEQIHRQIGEGLAELGIGLIICVGENATYISEAAAEVSTGSVRYFKTKEEFFAQLGGLIKEADTVFVKASRGMHFEEIVKKLKEF